MTMIANHLVFTDTKSPPSYTFTIDPASNTKDFDQQVKANSFN